MLVYVSMTLLAQTNDSNYDPRQELIPRAPEIDAELPNATVPSGLLDSLFSNDALSGLLLVLGGVGSFLVELWSIYTVLAYIFSFICIILYIKATFRESHYSTLIKAGWQVEETKWNQQYRNQDRPSCLDDVMTHIASDNPNDWKLAIIEADIVLDKALIKMGCVGDSLGARLRQLTPTQLGSINDAWEAHRVRNKIAHEGTDFVLTKRLAEDTVKQYRRVLQELGVE